MSVLDDLFPQAPTAAPQVVHLVQPTPEPAKEEPQGLDKFQDFWKMPEGYKPPEQFDVSRLHETDPAKFQEAVGQMNFVQNINPESLAAVAAGGDEAVKALGTILNSVAQSVFMQSAATSNALLKSGIQKVTPVFENKIADQLRSNEVSRALSDSNPLFSNPATATLLAPLRTQLMTKYPDATPAQIAEMAKGYIQELAGVANPTPAQSGTTAVQETDWEKYFSTPTQLRG